MESGDSREGRWVGSQEVNQFNRGVEVGLGLRVTGVPASSSILCSVVLCPCIGPKPAGKSCWSAGLRGDWTIVGHG